MRTDYEYISVTKDAELTDVLRKARSFYGPKLDEAEVLHQLAIRGAQVVAQFEEDFTPGRKPGESLAEYEKKRTQALKNLGDPAMLAKLDRDVLARVRHGYEVGA